MNTAHLIRIALPCALVGTLFLARASEAAELVPPPGYYAAINERKGDAGSCPPVPPPYTGSLVFTSKYQGSDSARATLNAKAERSFRSQIQDITDMERGTSSLVNRYMRDGRDGDLVCALNWMSAWARAGALQSDTFNHTGKSMRKWALGSLSSAYLRLKFSRSQPLASHAAQSREIEDWFGRLGTQVVSDWSNLPLKKINNHSYWAAWAVMSTAVATNRRDLFDWAVSEFKVAANQVDDDGYLPNELKRRQRALAYHNYALPPLAMIAAFALANGVDLRQENHGALQRLAERVLSGANDEKGFEQRTGKDQDMTDLKVGKKYAWLEPYCTLYRCDTKMTEEKKEREPFNNFRLGGDVTKVFDPRAEESPPPPGKRPFPHPVPPGRE